MPSPRLAYKAYTLAEAYLVRDFLRAGGVEAFVRGEHLIGAAGGLAADLSGAEVWVPDAHAERARELLAEADAREAHEREHAREHGGRLSPSGGAGGELSQAASPLTCPACGEDWEPGFEVCWSCEYAV